MRLRQGLVKKVELRTSPGVFEERHATWLELFYDLAFVAAIGQVSTALSHDLGWAGVARFFALFVPLWWAWVGQAFYLSRFDSDDLVHRVSALAQILLIGLIAVNIPRAFEGHAQGFALSYAALRCILILQYVIAGIQLPKARMLTTRYSIGFGIAVVAWVASAYVPAPFNMAMWGLAIAIDLYTPFTCPELNIKIPPDYSHIPERFGLFTIIVLGEAILAAMIGLRFENLGRTASLTGVFGLVLSFALWWIYFDGVKGQQVQIPERAKDVPRLLVWLFSHMPLAGGIIVAAVAIKHAILIADGRPMSPTEGMIFALAVFVVFASLQVIYWAGLHPRLIKIAHRLAWPHYLTTVGVLLVLVFCGAVPSVVAVALLTSLAVVHVLLTFRDLPEMDDLLRRVESAKRQTASSV